MAITGNTKKTSLRDSTVAGGSKKVMGATVTKVQPADAENPPMIPPGQPSIKHIIRGISARGIYDAEAKAYPVEEVEEYINGFLANGYRLAHCQHIGHIKAADGVNVIAEEMLYVLIRD